MRLHTINHKLNAFIQDIKANSVRVHQRQDIGGEFQQS